MLIKLITILHLTAVAIDPFKGSRAVTVYVTYVGLLYQYLSEIPNPSLIFWCPQIAVKVWHKNIKKEKKKVEIKGRRKELGSEKYIEFLNSNMVEQGRVSSLYQFQFW